MEATTGTLDAPTPELPDRAEAATLKQALSTAGYSLEGIKSALGVDRELSSAAVERNVYLRRLGARTPLGTLIRLFVLGDTVPAAEADTAFAGVGRGRVEALRLVESAAGGVRGLVRLVPHGDLFIACDRNPDYEDGATPAMYVPGLNPPAVLLASLSVRRRTASALDLGTGNGIQALLAASYAERVTASDINPRAIAFARFNARLNSVENIEFVTGDLFQPVAGRRFELIVSNPPYVISPESSFAYRDSGQPRDSLCRRIVEEMPSHLEEGGYGQLLASWVTEPGQDWSAPIRPWFEGRGCDAWLLHYHTQDPISHAADWNKPLSARSLAEHPQRLDHWIDYYRREEIKAITFGAIMLRRRQGANWVRTDDLRGIATSAGPHVERVFAAEDFLHALGDESKLLDRKLRLVPGHDLAQSFHAEGSAWKLESSNLSLTEGIAFSGNLDQETGALVARLDGSRTLREAAGGVERKLALAVGRRLFELGFLELAD